MGTFAKTAIFDYGLPTKEIKLPFSVSIFSTQTEVCHSYFPFVANKQKLPFSDISGFLYIHKENKIYL
jgi:hypothetical protein